MKMLYILIITIPMLFFGSIQGYAQPKECPVLSELEKTSIKDKKEVIKALNTLIPKTYGTGIDDFPDIYTKWNVVTAKPFPETVGNKDEEDYFGMAKTFCGKEIAEKSWLVRLDFPKAPGANLGQGQIFLAKSKEKGWFVWFQYH
ncbi:MULTISPECIES: hypothetical protein [Peribacillus]|uniref:Uncharacterized protein n=2 Tax=Peribacillus TaxID=2675229 RepID=A0AAW7IM20_9BACI|nr:MULTISPECIES: hypothetical protein [Peribacillus]MCY9141727.1 hypothetical protein [Peribacillus frigoritolerans]MDM5455399.1 hypothetical protein [Peribacillus simplex]